VGYRLLIARRYLASRRQVSLISVLTGISIAGVALGVMSLIVVLSVMNGFFDIVRDLLVSLDPHVRIESVHGGGIAAAEVPVLTSAATALPQVEEVAAYVEGKALLMHEGQGESNRVVIVRGVDPDTYKRVVPARGSFGVDGRGVVIGLGLGERLGLMPRTDQRPGGQIALLSAAGIGQMLTRFFAPPALEQFEVRGHFMLEPTYDNTHVFIGLPDAQRLFHTREAVTGIELRLDDLNQAAATQRALQAVLDPARYRVQTWYDLQKSLYDVMRLEKWGASIVLILITIVAAFNIVGSLSMVVIEKRRDIGVLKAMGMRRREIRRIFLLEGALIGALGTGIGFLLGLSLALAQQHFALVPLFGAESFVIDAYPVSIHVLDLVIIGTVSSGLCLLAALYPAHRASRLLPARAVQAHR